MRLRGLYQSGEPVKKRYVQMGLIIAALALGIALVSMFAGFDAVTVQATDHAPS